MNGITSFIITGITSTYISTTADTVNNTSEKTKNKTQVQSYKHKTMVKLLLTDNKNNVGKM